VSRRTPAHVRAWPAGHRGPAENPDGTDWNTTERARPPVEGQSRPRNGAPVPPGGPGTPSAGDQKCLCKDVRLSRPHKSRSGLGPDARQPGPARRALPLHGTHRAVSAHPRKHPLSPKRTQGKVSRLTEGHSSARDRGLRGGHPGKTFAPQPPSGDPVQAFRLGRGSNKHETPGWANVVTSRGQATVTTVGRGLWVRPVRPRAPRLGSRYLLRSTNEKPSCAHSCTGGRTAPVRRAYDLGF